MIFEIIQKRGDFIMRLKIAFVFLISMLLMNICSARSVVRVSDYGSDGFFYRYNENAQKMEKNHVLIKKIPQLQENLSNENYSTYVGMIGSEGHEITISLFANMEGYVSKIMIGGTATDSDAMGNVGDILAVTLSSLGVNKGEMARFFEDWKDSNLTDILHWCSASERFIIISRNVNYDYNTFSATFTAAA